MNKDVVKAGEDAKKLIKLRKTYKGNQVKYFSKLTKH